VWTDNKSIILNLIDIYWYATNTEDYIMFLQVNSLTFQESLSP
jgi:hypothetical protein